MDSTSTSKTSIPEILDGEDDNTTEGKLKKYKKVISTSPCSTDTYVLETDSDDSACNEVDANSNPVEPLRWRDRLREFDELFEYDEFDDYFHVQEEGIFEIAEPESYYSSSDSEVGTAASNIDNVTKQKYDMLRFSESRHSSRKKLPDHFEEETTSGRATGDNKSGTVNVTSSSRNQNQNQLLATRSRKISLPKRVKSAFGGFACFKKRNNITNATDNNNK